MSQDTDWLTKNGGFETAKKEIDDLQQRITGLSQLAPDNQRVQALSAAALGGVSYLQQKYPNLTEDASIAGQAISGLSSFVDTFKENPGRRLLSIYLGSLIGLGVSAFLGLNVITAALSDPGTSISSGTTTAGTPANPSGSTVHAGLGGENFPGLGIALTGLLVGLGANPTHEVIRAIQEYKKSQKSANDPVPSLALRDDATGDTGALTLSVAAAAPGVLTRVSAVRRSTAARGALTPPVAPTPVSAARRPTTTRIVPLTTYRPNPRQ